MKIHLAALATTTLLCQLNGGTALAQVAGSATPQSAAAIDDAANNGLVDIIVTATRQSENLQKAPVTVTALTADKLAEQGVRSFADLTGQVPSLNIGQDGMVFLRGFGTTNTREEGAPGTSVYQDGVYLGSPWLTTAVGYYDIDRVEVLTGPQGTLFGRNSTVGAINAITKKPKLGIVEGEVSAGYGNYNAIDASGIVNLPLGEKVALRAVAGISRHDYYNPSTAPGPKKGFNNKDITTIRASLLYQPTDDFSIIVRGDYISDHSLRSNWQIGRVAAGTRPTNFDSRTPYDLFLDGDYWGVSAELNWRIGPGTLTYLGAYRDTQWDNNNEYVPLGIKIRQNIGSRTKQHELRYAGTSGPLKYVFGAFYYHNQLSVDVGFPQRQPWATPPGFFSYLQTPSTETSKAVYGQLTYGVTDRLRLTGGLRYSTERKTRDGQNVIRYTTDPTIMESYGPFDTSRTVVTLVNRARGKWNSTDWKAGVDFDVSSTSLLYANAGTGFKTGGYDDGINNLYNPERVLTFEVGSKNRFLDNRLQVNFNGYYSKYKDLQVVGILIFNNVPTAKTYNAGKAHAWGMDIDIQAKPTENDNLNLTVGLLKGKYDVFKLLGDDYNPGPVDYSGNRLRAAPRLTVTAGYSHDFDIASGKITPRIQTRYTSMQFMHYTNFPVSRQPGFFKSDASLTYSVEDSWSIQAFVRNIENKIVYSYVFPSDRTSGHYYLQDPRTYGVAINAKF